MKIVYNGLECNDAKQEITCYYCKSKLEIEPNDLGKFHSDQREGDSYEVICPVCHYKIYIDTSVLNEEMKKAGLARRLRR